MGEQADRLKERTMRFAINVCRLLKRLPVGPSSANVSKQLAKSSTSTAANYRAACRARSHLEFTARIAIVAEEADESSFWLDFVAGAELLKTSDLDVLRQEASELAAIFSKAVGTARRTERQRH